jgi:hypothetical protein
MTSKIVGLILVLAFDLGVSPALLRGAPEDDSPPSDQADYVPLVFRYCEECRQIVEGPPAAEEGLWHTSPTVPAPVFFPSGNPDMTRSPGFPGAQLLYLLMSLQR